MTDQPIPDHVLDAALAVAGPDIARLELERWTTSQDPAPAIRNLIERELYGIRRTA